MCVCMACTQTYIMYSKPAQDVCTLLARDMQVYKTCSSMTKLRKAAC